MEPRRGHFSLAAPFYIVARAIPSVFGHDFVLVIRESVMKVVVDDAVYLGACPLHDDECRNDRRHDASNLANTHYLEDISHSVVHCYAITKTD